MLKTLGLSKKLQLCCYALSSKSYATKSTGKKQTDFQYCMDLVRTNDFEAYLTTLLSPKEVMRAAFALKALNIELASIGRSREPKISIAKLQFWKDQIERIFQHTNKDKTIKLHEPISNELAIIIKSHSLNKTWFNRIIEGRKNFLNMQQFKNVEELEKNADYSNIYYILFNCMNIKNVDCDHAANHIGKAQLLCAVTKNIIKKSAQSAYYLPTDLLVKHKISQQDLFNFSERILRPKRQNLKDLAFEFCTRANEHLKCARNLSSKIPKNAKPILVSSISCEVFLTKMEKYDFDLMDPKLNSDFRTTFITKLIMAKFKNIY